MTPAQLQQIYLATKDAEGCSPAYLDSMAYHLGRFLPAMPASTADWTPDDVTLWLAAQRKDGVKPGTVATRQRYVWAFLGWLVKSRRVPHDLRAGIARVKVPQERQRAVSPELFEHLMMVARQRPTLRDGRPGSPQHYYRNVALLHVLYSTGVRRNELAQIRLEHVRLKAARVTDPLDNTIALPGEITKSKRPRVVPLDRDAVNALRAYLQHERGTEPGLLFRMTNNAIKQHLRHFQERVCERVSSHDFRRGFASKARAAGLDVGHTMQLGGWRSPAMAMRYAESTLDESAVSAYRRMVG